MERQYAYGPGIDDVLLLFDKNGASYDAYYYLKHPLWTVEALVDEDATIVEAYAYEVAFENCRRGEAVCGGCWFLLLRRLRKQWDRPRVTLSQSPWA